MVINTHFSWSVFYSALIEETKGTYLAYFKTKPEPVYLNESIKTAIYPKMKKIKIDRKISFLKNIPQRYRDYHIKPRRAGDIFPITGIQAFSRLARRIDTCNVEFSDQHSSLTSAMHIKYIELVIFFGPSAHCVPFSRIVPCPHT